MQNNCTEIPNKLLDKANKYLTECDDKIGSLEDNERISVQDQIDMVNSMLVKLAYFYLDQKDNSSQSYDKEAIYQETSLKLNDVLNMYSDGELPATSVINFFAATYYPCREGYYPYLVGSYYDSLDTIYARNSEELNDLIRVQLQMDPRYGLDENGSANNAQQQHNAIMEEEQINPHILQQSESQTVQQLGQQLDQVNLGQQQDNNNRIDALHIETFHLSSLL